MHAGANQFQGTSDNSTVVIDVGSRVTRAGLGSTEFPDPHGPRICVESAVIRQSDASGALEVAEDDRLTHEQKNRFYSYPVNRGSIDDIDGLECVIREVLYTHAGWSRQDSAYGTPRGVVLVEPVMQSRSTREQLVQLMFETFNVSSYFATDAAVASLYSIGKTSGIVVDVGYDKVDVSPVLEGVVHASSAVRIPGFGGHAMTEMVKERYGLGYDQAEEKKLGGEQEVVEFLGREITRSVAEIGNACLSASMVSLVAGEREWRKTLMEQMFVCGGGSRLSGFGGALFEDVLEKHRAGFKPGMLAVPDYMPSECTSCASFYGGHLLAQVVMGPNVKEKQCLTRAMYEEHGPGALWRKFN
jgi:actin-related protein 7